jgi:hypothetical protein
MRLFRKIRDTQRRHSPFNDAPAAARQPSHSTERPSRQIGDDFDRAVKVSTD